MSATGPSGSGAGDRSVDVRSGHRATLGLAAGAIGGTRVPGYRGEEGVAAGSTVETHAALRLDIDNVRWTGVPFYLQSGKRMAARSTEIVVQFKPAPHTPFDAYGAGGAVTRPNTLIATIAPHEGGGGSDGSRRHEAGSPGPAAADELLAREGRCCYAPER
ncbi:MAG: hypothetical protein ACLGIJ_13690 [Candidatus Limnocylindria bacterium]